MKNQELIVVAANALGDLDVFAEVGGKVVAARGAEIRNGRLVVFTSTAAPAKKTAPAPAPATADEGDDGSGTMDPPPKPPEPVDPPVDTASTGATIE